MRAVPPANSLSPGAEIAFPASPPGAFGCAPAPRLTLGASPSPARTAAGDGVHTPTPGCFGEYRRMPLDQALSAFLRIVRSSGKKSAGGVGEFVPRLRVSQREQLM